MTFDLPVQYLLLLQKQPGIRDEAFYFWLTAPEKVALVTVESPTKMISPLTGGQRTSRNFFTSFGFYQDVILEAGLKR